MKHGVRPSTTSKGKEGRAIVGAVEGDQERETDADIERLAQDLDRDVEGEDQAEHRREAGGEPEDGSDGEEGPEPVLRNAPTKPDQDEVDRHYTTHVPRRLWCPICAEASLEEDPPPEKRR